MLGVLRVCLTDAACLTQSLSCFRTGVTGSHHGELPPQVAPVVDASSSQSRADVVIIGLSAVLVLTGLQWLSLRPKPLVAVSAYFAC